MTQSNTAQSPSQAALENFKGELGSMVANLLLEIDSPHATLSPALAGNLRVNQSTLTVSEVEAGVVMIRINFTSGYLDLTYNIFEKRMLWMNAGHGHSVYPTDQAREYVDNMLKQVLPIHIMLWLHQTGVKDLLGQPSERQMVRTMVSTSIGNTIRQAIQRPEINEYFEDWCIWDVKVTETKIEARFQLTDRRNVENAMTTVSLTHDNIMSLPFHVITDYFEMQARAHIECRKRLAQIIIS